MDDRTVEVDLDAFLGYVGPVVELDDEGDAVVRPGPAHPFDEPALDSAIEAERARMQQLTMEGTFVGIDEAVPGAERNITAVIFRSRTGNAGHVVTVLDLPAGRTVACNCPAIRNLSRRPQGCWAMVYVRRLVGIEGVG